MQELYQAGTYFDQVDTIEGDLVEARLDLKAFHDGTSMKENVKKFKTMRTLFNGPVRFIRDACFYVNILYIYINYLKYLYIDFNIIIIY